MQKIHLFDLMKRSETNREEQFQDLCIQIDNILSSYDDTFDVLSEIVQNSVDGLLRRWDNSGNFEPLLMIHVDGKNNAISVLDNGCGVHPEHFTDVIRPNCSLKRRLKQKSARGEKGAAMAFLQFGHHQFEFHSKVGSQKKSYMLSNGLDWFKQMAAVLESDTVFDSKQLPPESFDFYDTITPDLESHDSGSFCKVVFGNGSRVANIADYFGDTIETSMKRFEYLLRTRTAVGLIDIGGESEECLENLKVKLKITHVDGSFLENEIEVGYFYPHLIAKTQGSPASYMTDPKGNSEVLFDTFDKAFLLKYFETFFQKPQNKEILQKYKLSGYISYAHHNQYYEKITCDYLGLISQDPDYDTLRQELIQINGGFQISVKKFPNGRRHSFLQRSGAEDKSRTFVVLDFKGPYKPDYGRKNVSGTVRNFVNEFCKELIKFSVAPERRKCLYRSKDDSTFSIRNLREAREILANQADNEAKKGIWCQKNAIMRTPRYENEVAYTFALLVHNGRLPGFRLYGLPEALQLDCLFDYELDFDRKFVFDQESTPLGVYFPDRSKEIHSIKQWAEFKLSSDLLVADLKKKEGEPGKKYFETIELLVCDTIDDATDDYSVEEITSPYLAQERTYYGVTHLLKNQKNQSHVIQVICLSSLRKIWEDALG